MAEDEGRSVVFEALCAPWLRIFFSRCVLLKEKFLRLRKKKKHPPVRRNLVSMDLWIVVQTRNLMQTRKKSLFI